MKVAEEFGKKVSEAVEFAKVNGMGKLEVWGTLSGMMAYTLENWDEKK